ncbi:hypothetical protein FRC00_003082, partial [Tulasnella sp. 408]
MLLADLMNSTFCMWDLRTMQSAVAAGSHMGFPEPFADLRVRGQWLFYKDSRTFWLPLEFIT